MSSDHQFYRGRITRRVDFAPDLWSIRIDPGGEFKFRPGQYATLGVQSTDKRSERAYSIVSSPHENEVEFFIELVPGGELTPQLHDLQSGNEILIRRVPKGRFLLDTDGARRNHLLVSTVTGVAPYVSYIRSLMNDEQERRFPAGHRLFLLNGASHSWEFGYHQEIADIASTATWLTYVPTISRAWEDVTWDGERGRVDDLLRKYVDEWRLTGEDTLAYLCGHPEMIEHSKSILRRKGFPNEAIREEIYWIAPTRRAVGESRSPAQPARAFSMAHDAFDVPSDAVARRNE
jgi:ferredoxin--NADP+ reductase